MPDDNLLSVLWGRKSGCWKIVAGPPEVHMNKNWLGDGGGSQEVCGD